LGDAAVSNPVSSLGCTDPKILEFIAAANAENTQRAYQSDLRHFLAWGGHLPATPQQVARYLADHAASLSTATLARRLAGVRAAHVERGFPDPTKSELVRLTFRGIRRKHGQSQRRVAALTFSDLSAIIPALGHSAKDLRDAAILLVGFAGAFRRSELTAMDYKQIEIGEHDAVIQIPRSKTDQEGHGRTIRITRTPGALCPIAALQAWLLEAGITEGPVFRPLIKNGKLRGGRISPGAIASIVKQHVSEIGRNPNCYSGHSLRAGFATEAARLGVPKWRIKAQTGHLSDSAVERYIREGEQHSSDAPNVLTAFAARDASNGSNAPNIPRQAPKSREGCIIHRDGRISDAEFHEPILSRIGAGAEAPIIEVSKEYARRVGLSEEEIKKLYG
jgi:integrase